ncbi:hypothetical protein H5410_006807 [Solanum commersonii]|uniref:Uncharacterized protein n=1 Tax=Solanum commersonii TaxID=4109 RepID=A0A9J6AAD0_SOLCO|nr:hypothetical protein H5410_006807 [Solanum commersonii]
MAVARYGQFRDFLAEFAGISREEEENGHRGRLELYLVGCWKRGIKLELLLGCCLEWIGITSGVEFWAARLETETTDLAVSITEMNRLSENRFITIRMPRHFDVSATGDGDGSEAGNGDVPKASGNGDVSEDGNDNVSEARNGDESEAREDDVSEARDDDVSEARDGDVSEARDGGDDDEAQDMVIDNN